MDWTYIRDFLAVAETGSLLGAAKLLKTSQPTVGRRITAMEESVGKTLFIRTNSGLELTDIGALLLVHAERMRYEAMAAERVLTGIDTQPAGDVTISVIESLGTQWLTHEMQAFSAAHPDISLEIRVELSAADLIRREADIAIRMFEPNQLDLISKKAGSLALGIYASKNYLTHHPAPQTIEDLKQHRVIMASKDYLAFLEKHWRQVVPETGPVAFRSNNMNALMNATKAGYGIGVHSCLMADQQDDLVRLIPDYTFANLDFWLVTHSDLRKSARIRLVYDYISDLLKKNRRRLLGLSD